MNQTKGNLYVISGFSGSGKGTIMEHFRNRSGYALSVSCTSRKPRPGEQEGISYYFISHEEFLKRAEEGFFLEHAVYVDHGYGTPAAFVEEHLAAGDDVLLEIELQGALQIRKKIPDAGLIFVTPPTIQILRERLENRKTESQAEIRKRLLRAVEEGKNIGCYDYILVNDKVEDAVAQLEGLMRARRSLVSANAGFIRGIGEDLQKLKQELDGSI